MTLKLSMLTAVAVIAIPMAVGAQTSSGSNSAPKAQQTQSDADDGLTPAQRASKKSARPKAKAPTDVTAQDAPAATPAPAPQSRAPAPTTATPQSTAPGQAGTTPGQAQTSPGEASQLTPTQTGQTPSGAAVPNPSAGQAQAATDDAQGGGAAKPATAADVKAGALVYDSKGVAIGKIESVSGKNAILSSGDTKASIPISSFAKNGKGLVIGMTKSEFEAATKKQ